MGTINDKFKSIIRTISGPLDSGSHKNFEILIILLVIYTKMFYINKNNFNLPFETKALSAPPLAPKSRDPLLDPLLAYAPACIVYFNLSN
jgi:hypothetical protein